MIAQQTSDAARKTIAILKILGDSPQPLGSRVLARRLRDLGIDLGERAVRYHLRQMDEMGLTRIVGQKDGRFITESGIEELNSVLLTDRVGQVASRIESLAYHSSFNPEEGLGKVPVNLSLFECGDFDRAIEVIKIAFGAGLGVSRLAAVAAEGGSLGETVIPPGNTGLATVSHIVVCGALMRAGIPVDFRFGGIVQIRCGEPLRFVELIDYAGCSLDPSEIFIASGMTSVISAAREGNGKILASFCEIPSVARSRAETIINSLELASMNGVLALGKIGESVCGLPVAFNKVGIVFTDGLNPVSAALEAGLNVVNYTMRGVIDSGKLIDYKKL